MAETKADLEAKLAERDREIADLKAKLEAQPGVDLAAKLAERDQEIADLKAQLEAAQAGQPASAVAAEPDGGPISVDLPASRVPYGADPFTPDKPEPGQYVGHGATSIASSYGTFEVDPSTGLVVGPAGSKPH